jgi:16S rRNA (cytidine1402-2'-O)-methyltransferase
MSKLYIVATPIGNLEDISGRALNVLKEVDFILCEDTRVTNRLLASYDIGTPTLSYHQHSELQKVNQILDLLQEGKDLALVTDGGTPGISDPGNKLIEEILKLETQVEIIPIPGPCALIAAASISGIGMDKFIFMGFPPAKRKRKKFFEEVVNYDHPVVLYESPYRIIKTLEELKEFDVSDVIVCRELTKKFESFYRGKIEDVINNIKNDKIKGEFVIIIHGK